MRRASQRMPRFNYVPQTINAPSAASVSSVSDHLCYLLPLWDLVRRALYIYSIFMFFYVKSQHSTTTHDHSFLFIHILLKKNILFYKLQVQVPVPSVLLVVMWKIYLFLNFWIYFLYDLNSITHNISYMLVGHEALKTTKKIWQASRIWASTFKLFCFSFSKNKTKLYWHSWGWTNLVKVSSIYWQYLLTAHEWWFGLNLVICRIAPLTVKQNSTTSHFHDLPTSAKDFSVFVLWAAAGWCLGHIAALLAFRSDSFWLFCFRKERGIGPVHWTTDHLWPKGVNQVVSSWLVNHESQRLKGIRKKEL